MTDNGENMGVTVKPLVWHNFDAWTWWAEAVSGTYCVNERDGTWTGSLRFRDAVHIVYEVGDFDTVIAACNDDNRARVMAELIPATRAPITVQDAARVPEIAALIESCAGLNRIVEEIDGAMSHGDWHDKNGNRLKDTPEWVALYVARAALRAIVEGRA